MNLISIRLKPEAVEQLRTLARKEAVRRNENVTWAGLVREAIDERLTRESQQRPSQQDRAHGQVAVRLGQSMSTD